MFPGEIYFVQTDQHGDIIYFTNAEYNSYIQGDWGEYVNSETEALIFEIIENNVSEIAEYLKAGMTILFDREMIMLDGEDCYLVVLGTNHEDYFVKELFYAVNIFTQQI